MIPSAKENYRFDLLDVRWQLKRNVIINRDKVCQRCGSDKLLDVHHTYYIYGIKPWEYDEEYLITLCRSCHDREHSDLKSLKELITEMLKSNIWASEIREKIQEKL